MEASTDPSDAVGDFSDDDGPNVHMLLKIVILGVIGFVSVIGNCIALGTLVVYRHSLRIGIGIYIVIGGLALADIVIASMDVPDRIMFQADKGDLKSETWCKVYGLLVNSCQYIKAFHLVVLGVLRGILLTDRAHHAPTAIHALITCAILWTASLLANIPMITSSIHDSMTKGCVIDIDLNRDEAIQSDSTVAAEERYLILSSAFSYFLPLVLIIIIYLFTGYMSKRFFEDSYSRRERRLSKMISCLIVTFSLCHLPSETVNLLWFYQVRNKEYYQLQQDNEKYQIWLHIRDYLQILAMFDMAIRPIIYATMSREFGRVYDQVINCTYCRIEEEEELPPRLRHRGREIEEVMSTPLRHDQDNLEFTEAAGTDNETEEIF